MNKQELKSKIEKLEKGLASKVTPENLKASLKTQKEKFEKELADLEKKATKEKSIVSDKIKALKDKVKSKVSSINRDGARKAKAAGKRVAADGSIYYEKRANRTDSQTNKKPYLEKGGYMANGGKLDKDISDKIDQDLKLIIAKKEKYEKELKQLKSENPQDKDSITYTEYELESLNKLYEKLNKIKMGNDKMAKGGAVKKVPVTYEFKAILRDEDDNIKEKKEFKVKAIGRDGAYNKAYKKYPKPYFVELYNSYPADKMSKGGLVKIKSSSIEDADFQSLSQIFESNDTQFSIDESEKYVLIDLKSLPNGDDKEKAIDIISKYKIEKMEKGGDLYDDMDEDIEFANKKAKALANSLKGLGFNILEVAEADYDTDANISLSENVNVNVSLEGELAIVVDEGDGKFLFIDCGKSFATLLQKLKKLEEKGTLKKNNMGKMEKGGKAPRTIKLTLSDKDSYDYTYKQDGTTGTAAQITFGFGKEPFQYEVKKISKSLEPLKQDILDAFTIQGIKQHEYKGGFSEAIKHLDTKVVYEDNFEKGGYMAEGGALNLEIRKLAQSKGLTPAKLGRDYELVMAQAVVESLTDANNHSEARKLISILENKPEWAESPNNENKPEFGTPAYTEWRKSSVYSSEYYDADEKTRDFAIEVSQKSGWDGHAIAKAFEYLLKIEGGYHKLAKAIAESMKEDNTMEKGGSLSNEEYDKLTREYDKLAALAEDAVGEEKEEYKRELEKVAQKIHREERGYSEGGSTGTWDSLDFATRANVLESLFRIDNGEDFQIYEYYNSINELSYTDWDKLPKNIKKAIENYNGNKMAKGGITFAVGQSVIYPLTNNNKLDKSVLSKHNEYANKELVIEKIEVGEPYNSAKVFVKSTGGKVPFDLILNPRYLKHYANDSKNNLDKKIKEYYINEYPTDDLGEDINPKATFSGLSDVLDNKKDAYHYIGVSDSLVRERIFEKLSNLKGVDYDVIYQKWLDSDDEYAKGGETSKNISVFGYDTLNFDMCPLAVEEFEKAANSIEASGNENAKVSLSRAAMYVDDVFGVEKKAKSDKMVSKSEFEYAVNQSLVASAYNYAAGLEANLFKFMPMHITELAKLLNHVEESKKVELTAYDLLVAKEKVGESAFKNMTIDERKNLANELKNSFEDGGTIEDSNYRMVVSQTKAIKHHASELLDALNPDTQVEAWVVGKIERASTDLADVSHYIDGLKMEQGGYMAKGGENKIDGFTNEPIYTKGNISVQRIGGSSMWNVAVNDKQKGRILDAFTKEQALIKAEKEYGGKMAKGGELANGAYYLGKPKKEGEVWSQTVVDISGDSIDFAKDYAKKIKEFNATGKKRLSNEEFAKFLKEDKRGDNLSPEFEKWESYADGGMIVGRWYKDNKGVEHRYIGEDASGKSLFSDGERVSPKSLDEFETKTKESKLFGLFEEGGELGLEPKVDDIVDFGEGLEKITRLVKTPSGKEFIEAVAIDGSSDRRNLYSKSEWAEVLKNQEQYKKDAQERQADQAEGDRLRKEKEDLEQSKIAEYNDIDGFGENLTPMQKGKVLQFLNKKVWVTDGKKTRQVVIKNELRELAKKDWYIKPLNGVDKIRYKEGEDTFIIPDYLQKKISMEYLEHLKENKKMAKGGKIKSYKVTTDNKIWADDLLKYADLQKIKASVKKVGKKFILTFEAIPEVMESMTNGVKDLVKKMGEGELLAKGGQTKFSDKVKAIKASLLKGKKVSPKVQKDYGKTYNAKEAEQAAKRIAGAMRKKDKK